MSSNLLTTGSACPIMVSVSCHLLCVLATRIFLSQHDMGISSPSVGYAWITAECVGSSSSKRTRPSCVVELIILSCTCLSMSAGKEHVGCGRGSGKRSASLLPGDVGGDAACDSAATVDPISCSEANAAVVSTVFEDIKEARGSVGGRHVKDDRVAAGFVMGESLLPGSHVMPRECAS